MITMSSTGSAARSVTSSVVVSSTGLISAMSVATASSVSTGSSIGSTATSVSIATSASADTSTSESSANSASASKSAAGSISVDSIDKSSWYEPVSPSPALTARKNSDPLVTSNEIPTVSLVMPRVTASPLASKTCTVNSVAFSALSSARPNDALPSVSAVKRKVSTSPASSISP